MAKKNMCTIKVNSLYNLSKMVEALVVSGYELIITPVYSNSTISIGPPTPEHFIITYQEKATGHLHTGEIDFDE